MASKWEKEKQNLEKLILVDKLSYEEIGRLYKCTGANIKKQAKWLGIQLPSKRKINSKETFNKGNSKLGYYNCKNCGVEFKAKNSKNHDFCCINCRDEFRKKQSYQRILRGDPEIMRSNFQIRNNIKKIITEEQGGVCAICGITPEWNGKPLVFILDHIDGKASNNQRSNLRCICSNCDSQLDTYKSKNKNGERAYHRFSHR
jgi:hypothetical protein